MFRLFARVMLIANSVRLETHIFTAPYRALVH